MNSAKPGSLVHVAQDVSALTSIRQDSDILGSLVVVALPFAFLYEAGFIGQLYGTELLFIVVLPFLWLTSAAPLAQPFRSTLWWLGAWLAVLVATDIYRGSFIGDYLRGWAKLIFFGIDIYVLGRLLTTERRLLLWCIGWSAAFAISTWSAFDDFATRWKFGIGLAVVSAVAALGLLFWQRRRSVLAAIMALLCLGAGVTSLFLNARNSFLSLSLSGLLLSIAAVPALRRGFIALWDRHGYLVLAGALAAAYFAGVVYVEGASVGFFGDEAREKLEAQRSDASDPVLGALAGGRDEFYSSSAAISDSPIVGYGSWARSAYYYNVFVEKLHAHGTPEQIREVESKMFVGEPLIPTHSHLLGAWVEAGIVGAVFWIVVLRRALQAVRRSLGLGSSIDILVLVTTAPFAWNVLFSPFGGAERLVEAFPLVLFLYAPHLRDKYRTL